MTIIIGIFTRDNLDNKEIFFASDGRAVIYEDNKKIKQYENAEKIHKLTPKVCMGYAGKNSELFDDVYKKLKSNTPNKIKREIRPFSKRLQELIIEMLNTKRHREIEEANKKYDKTLNKFITVGLFHGRLILITLDSDKKYKIVIREEPTTFPAVAKYVAGSEEEIQNESMALLDNELERIYRIDEIENVIKNTITKIAVQYPQKINNHVFIRRLSEEFNLKRY